VENCLLLVTKLVSFEEDYSKCKLRFHTWPIGPTVRLTSFWYKKIIEHFLPLAFLGQDLLLQPNQNVCRVSNQLAASNVFYWKNDADMVLFILYVNWCEMPSFYCVMDFLIMIMTLI